MLKLARIVTSLVFIAAVTLSSTKANADVWSRLYQYYSNSSFTCQVGETFVPGTHCPDDDGYSWGTTGDYRKLTIIQECGTTSGDGTICGQFYDGYYHTITCP